MSDTCWLKKDPIDQWGLGRQCCCNCRSRLIDYKHCTIHGRSEGKCVCDEVKGYICAGLAPERYYSEWPEHSAGCELYTPKNGSDVR